MLITQYSTVYYTVVEECLSGDDGFEQQTGMVPSRYSTVLCSIVQKFSKTLQILYDESVDRIAS